MDNMSRIQEYPNDSSNSTAVGTTASDMHRLSCLATPFIGLMNSSLKGFVPTPSSFYSPQVSEVKANPNRTLFGKTSQPSMTVFEARSLPDITVSYQLIGGFHGDIRPVDEDPDTRKSLAWIVTKTALGGKITLDGTWIQRASQISQEASRWTWIAEGLQEFGPMEAMILDESRALEGILVFWRDSEEPSQRLPGHTHVAHCSEFIYTVKPLQRHEVSAGWTPTLSRLSAFSPTSE